MTRIRQILITAAVLVGVVVLFEYTDIDLRVQDHCYDFQNRSWAVNRDEPVARMIFYTGAKGAAAVVGVACGLVCLLSLRLDRLRPYRQGCLRMTLSLIFVPLLIAGSKQFTNVYTPRQVQRYGGTNPYVKVLEKYPPDFKPTKRAKGFPAGHATGGFAFMMLYFVFRKAPWKWLGLAAGVTAGWSMGIYQTLNGEHYLSHTIVTMLAAWIVILVIQGLVFPRRVHCDQSEARAGY